MLQFFDFRQKTAHLHAGLHPPGFPCQRRWQTGRSSVSIRGRSIPNPAEKGSRFLIKNQWQERRGAIPSLPVPPDFWVQRI
jgi:hypothetical protein